MSTESIDEGEVLWIEPELCRIPQLPNGFAFRVDRLLGWADPGHGVWIRGVVLLDSGQPVRSLTLCVPLDQPRITPREWQPWRSPVLGRAPVEGTNRRRGAHRRMDPPLDHPRRRFR